MAQPGAREAWEDFEERVREAVSCLADDLVAVLKTPNPPEPPDHLPERF
jgi:hypothetical protein